MDKNIGFTDISNFKHNLINESNYYKYKRYLPTAFDESMTILEKINKLNEIINLVVELSNDLNMSFIELVENWEKVRKYLLGEGLKTSLIEILELWLKDGTLETILSHEVLKNKVDQDSNYMSVTRFGVVGDGVTDDTQAFQEAIDSGIPLSVPEGTFIITDDLILKPQTKIKGLGIYKTIFKGVGSITVFNASDEDPLQDFRLEHFGIEGELNGGSVGIDLYYYTNNSLLDNIRVEKMDTAIRISKSWYARLNNLRLRDNGRVNLEFLTPSNIEQVNSLAINNSSLMLADNNVLIHGGAPNQNISFNNCELEASRQTCVFVRNAAPLSFNNCYFERNYTDAQVGNGSVVLTENNGIDIDMETFSSRTQLKIDGCYMSRSTNFNSGSVTIGILLRKYPQITMFNTILQSGASGYLDFDVYADPENRSTPKIFNVSREGYAKTLFRGNLNKHHHTSSNEKNARYTNTTKFNFVPVDQGTYYVTVTALADLTFITPSSLRVTNITGDTILSETVMEDLRKNTQQKIRIGALTGVDLIEIELTGTTEADSKYIYTITREYTE